MTATEHDRVLNERDQYRDALVDTNREVERLRVERDAAQEHVAYHLRDFRPGGDDKATGDLAVDVSAYAGRLKAEVDRLRAVNVDMNLHVHAISALHDATYAALAARTAEVDSLTTCWGDAAERANKASERAALDERALFALRAGIGEVLDADHCPGDPTCEHDDWVWADDGRDRLNKIRALLDAHPTDIEGDPR